MKYPKGRPPHLGIPEADCPPSRGLGGIPILSAPRTGHVLVCCLSQRYAGYLVHWDPNAGGIGKGATVPCLGNRSLCVWCLRAQVPKFKAYLAVRVHPTGQLAAAEITEGAFRHCPELKALQGQLRGRWLELGRLHHHKANEPAYVKVRPETFARELPASFDVAAFLQRLWGYDVRVFRTYEDPPVGFPDLAQPQGPE